MKGLMQESTRVCEPCGELANREACVHCGRPRRLGAEGIERLGSPGCIYGFLSSPSRFRPGCGTAVLSGALIA